MTGKLIKHWCLIKLPIPQAVIDRVAHFAKNSPSLDLILADRHRQPYDWPDAEIIGSDKPQRAPYPDIPANMLGVQLKQTRSSSPPPSPSPPDDPDWAQLADEALANVDIDHMDILPAPPEVIIVDDDDNVPLPHPMKQTLVYLYKFEPIITLLPIPQSPLSTVWCNPTHQQNPPQYLRDYNLFTTVADNVHTAYPYVDASGNTSDLSFTDENTIACVCHYVMLHCAESIFVGNPNNKRQYGLKAGLKKFAECGNDALMKELCQFHVLYCFSPKDPKTLSHQDHRNALASLMFLTEKYWDEIKACSFADGSKQPEHIAKNKATAPTVSSDTIFIQATIVAHEGHDVATCNIQGAFLQADNPNYVLMHLDGVVAKLMVTIAPNIYQKYITTNANGKPVLYVQLEKALYGMMISALLFYCNMSQTSTKIGFILNPYDPCVANKMLNGQQLSICWHVNNIFISHKDHQVVSDIIQWLLTWYKTATCGSAHDHLGMNIGFSNPSNVSFDMIPYITQILNKFPELITEVASTLEAYHLFKICAPSDASCLPELQATAYHHTTAQLLFLSLLVALTVAAN